MSQIQARQYQYCPSLNFAYEFELALNSCDNVSHIVVSWNVIRTAYWCILDILMHSEEQARAIEKIRKEVSSHL